MKKLGPQKRSLWFNLLLWLLLLIGIPICVCTVWSIQFLHKLNLQGIEREQNCAVLRSEPLPAGMTEYLCKSSLVPSHIADCNLPSLTLRSQDLISIMKANIRASSTYDEVTAMFGSYEYYCDSRDHIEFRCRYEFGRWPALFVFFDSRTEMATSIRAQSCSGS
jgi:hypothetical protein